MGMSKETIDEIHRLRWGDKRAPSAQLRVDRDVAKLVWSLPESERRSFLNRAIKAEYSRVKFVIL